MYFVPGMYRSVLLRTLKLSAPSCVVGTQIQHLSPNYSDGASEHSKRGSHNLPILPPSGCRLAPPLTLLLAALRWKAKSPSTYVRAHTLRKNAHGKNAPPCETRIRRMLDLFFFCVDLFANRRSQKLRRHMQQPQQSVDNTHIPDR